MHKQSLKTWLKKTKSEKLAISRTWVSDGHWAAHHSIFEEEALLRTVEAAQDGKLAAHILPEVRFIDDTTIENALNRTVDNPDALCCEPAKLVYDNTYRLYVPAGTKWQQAIAERQYMLLMEAVCKLLGYPNFTCVSADMPSIAYDGQVILMPAKER